MGFLRVISTILLFFLVPFLVDAHAYPSINRKEERDMGRQVEREAARQFKSVDDSYVKAYVAGVVGRISKVIRNEEFDVRVHIIESPVINAFTVPGGVVFLTTGVIFAMDSEEELAGVLAHEIAHVQSRHIAYRVDKGNMVNLATAAAILAAMVLGAKVDAKLGQAAFAFSVAGAQTKMLSFSRTDEEEADRIAAKTMDDSGYGSGGLATFLEKLRRISPVPNEVPAYLLTHPAPNDRVTMLKVGAKKFQPPPDPSKGYFWIFQARIAASDPRPFASKLILDRASSNPDVFSAQLGAAIFERNQGHYGDALKYFNACDRIMPDNPEAMHERALLELYSGNSATGVQRLERLRESGKASFGAMRDLGWAYLEKDRGADALGVYDELLKRAPDWDELPYRRGIALGKVGREPEGHLELGRYYLRFDRKTARRHLEKALATLPKGAKLEEATELLEKLNRIERDEIAGTPQEEQ